MLYCAPNHLDQIFVFVYIDKTCREYEPNQTMDYAVNPGLISDNNYYDLVSLSDF